MSTEPASGLAEFRLLILDIDGVMTDGTKVYGIDGDVIAKRFNDRDFTAIKRFKAAGVSVCFLSGDKRVNEIMAHSRKTDFYYSRSDDGSLDKATFVELFAKRYDVPPSRMAYIGDDYYDLSIIEKLEFTFCPADSPASVKEKVYQVMTRKGGEGVVAELYDEYENSLDSPVR